MLSKRHWIYNDARVPGTDMHEAEPCSKGVDDTHVSDQQVFLSVYDLELTCNET